jgi:hypothetical protein
MAHEIAIVNGQASMMYVGEPPWLGLGIRLDNPATAREAIVAAGLDYEVELARLATRGDERPPCGFWDGSASAHHMHARITVSSLAAAGSSGCVVRLIF